MTFSNSALAAAAKLLSAGLTAEEVSNVGELITHLDDAPENAVVLGPVPLVREGGGDPFGTLRFDEEAGGYVFDLIEEDVKPAAKEKAAPAKKPAPKAKAKPAPKEEPEDEDDTPAVFDSSLDNDDNADEDIQDAEEVTDEDEDEDGTPSVRRSGSASRASNRRR